MIRQQNGLQPSVHCGLASDDGCAESRLFVNRRDAMALTGGLFTWAFAPRLASAAGTPDPRLLIVLMRGGWDGLNILPNFGDAFYSSKRGTLALDENSQLPFTSVTGVGGLDSVYRRYRLNSAMKNFHQFFEDGQARIVLPIAPPLQTRSHFDCSFNLENGSPGNAKTDSGWLNRLLEILPAGNGLFQNRIPLQIGNTPVILTGRAPTISWTPASFQSNFFASLGGTNRTRVLERLYGADEKLSSIIESGLETNAKASVPDVNLPKVNGALGAGMAGAAKLLKAPDGPRIAVMTVDGFDTHSHTDVNSSKTLAGFDSSLGVFRAAMGGKDSQEWAQTLVVCVSEFGRSVTDNSAAGSDHGIGTVALLAGGVLKSSSIIGQWPVLDTRNLGQNNDVPAKYDTRDLFKSILKNHMGIVDVAFTRGEFSGQRLLSGVIFPDTATLPAGYMSLDDVLA